MFFYSDSSMNKNITYIQRHTLFPVAKKKNSLFFKLQKSSKPINLFELCQSSSGNGSMSLGFLNKWGYFTGNLVEK